MLLHGGDDLFEEYLIGQGVTVIDHWLHIWSIPAVNLQAAAAFPQSTVHTHARIMQVDAKPHRQEWELLRGGKYFQTK